MDLIRLAIARPTAIIAAVLMVVLFGLVALLEIPIQMTPDVRQPVITVNTSWPGAAPAEVEREIVNRQEDALKGLEGLREMSSQANTGNAEVTLEFNTGQNMDRALLLVANRLDQVSDYPDEADEPTLETSGSDDQPIAWFTVRRVAGNETPIYHYGDLLDDVVRDRLERVDGISRVNVYGGSERELRVTVDPVALSKYRITVPQVVTALRAANVSMSAGDVEEGKRRYVVRVEGQFITPADVEAVVVRSAAGQGLGGLARVSVGDVADVRFSYKEQTARIRYRGENALALNAVRDTGANVIETMGLLRDAVAALNTGVLAEQGLYLGQVYDETVYIEAAIDLVISNIYVGGTLAAIVLLVFLRAFGPTVIISLGIPVSVIGAFVGMAAMGRSLNVISLAGIAFAVGMVVDAAIVVLENIYRLREQGYSRAAAAYQGAKQVWGAILVSALTTVMVFIPILTMEQEVGQLFRDIAVAISVAVMLSLVVAITVIPALSRRLLGRVRRKGEGPAVPLPGIDQFGRGFSWAMTSLTAAMVRSRLLSLVIVIAITAAAGVVSWAYLPKLEYLPEGNRNLVFGLILPPPGYNLDTTTAIGQSIEDAVRPLWSEREGAMRHGLEDPGDRQDPADDEPGALTAMARAVADVIRGTEAEEPGPPRISNFFFVALETRAFVGAAAEESSRASDLIPVVRGPVFSEPGTFGFVSQPSPFGRSVGGARAVNLDISGADLETILGVALRAAGKVGAVLPRDEGHQMRPRPGLELGAPEVRVFPNLLRLADNGVSVLTFGQTVDAFNDGLRVDEITLGGERIDLTLAGPANGADRTQGIGTLPVVTESGTILPVSALGDVVFTAGPTEIRHLEGSRTVSLQIRPSSTLALERAMEIIEDDVIAPLLAEGIPPEVSMSLSGTADKLTEAWDAMVWQLLLALVIVYLVMAVLFENFFYPMVIMITVPLASAGAVLALALLNLFSYQPLDMLTMMGFVILIGIVVNNAILLVDQTLYGLRQDGLSAGDAIRQATANRVRPIFMSTLTSLMGMSPLVLFPGAGSELYRGLGTVVLGGLAMSALLTLIIIPALMSLVMPLIEGGRVRRQSGNTPKAKPRHRGRARRRARATDHHDHGMGLDERPGTRSPVAGE
ncbi:efflux RND transporter permease subunit [Roseospira visakhapatnamensis]|uniref:HAE1 family hydrophobic/amphiphilic exporter-1 n=1 Tax=Roseospira visakhapatnamensis TaxID=390880 RepID=A0A7W6RAQ3_9PROT|nr:efflux RND transporter permease subunit [Roseospira visakhapatnamensis]MBB4265075.1 HAE1 family hydrophobic/amphiphilic exporter-1 [Roseospira visakhapatnamensis]